MTPMTLTVPAQAEWTLVMRMAVSGVSAMCDIPLDVMDDLNTAVEESCDLLLHQDYSARALTLTCLKEKGSLALTLEAMDREEKKEAERADADIALLILKTLVSDVRFSQDAGGVYAVRLSLPAGA